MSRRRRASRYNPNAVQPKVADQGVTKSEVTEPRDWDSDAPDPHPAYTEAVGAVLERLEGLWYDSEYSHRDYADKVAWESAVNDEINIIKRKIQELL